MGHTITLRQLAEAAAVVYGYDDIDKTIIRRLAEADNASLRLALINDPLVIQYIEANHDKT